MTHFWTGPETPPDPEITMTPRCLNTGFDQLPVPKLVHPMRYGGSGQTPKIPSPEKALPNWQKVVKSLMRGRGS